MNNIGKTAIFIAIVALLIGVLFYTKNEKSKVVAIDINEIEEIVKDYEYVLVYFGEENDELTKVLKLYQNGYLLKAFYATSEVNEIKNYLSKYTSAIDVPDNDIYAVYVEGDFEGVIDTTDGTVFVEQLRKFLYGEIPESERNFKTLSTSEEFIKKVNSKDYTVAVFGATSCSFCTLYLPVINEVAGEYDLDIYYFDSDTYDAMEYDEIMELNYTIPAECTTTGYSTTMKAGFPKPMTIITKKGEFVDCIRGYVTKDVVVDKLKEYKIIEVK